MDSAAIFEALRTHSAGEHTYSVFLADDVRECYFGKDSEGNVVFMIPSTLSLVAPVYQETRSLRFAFNKKCSFLQGETVQSRVMHVLVCKERAEDKILAFIRLTKAFAQTERDNDQLYLMGLFSSIAVLFSAKKEPSEIELQGLFAELYTILHFHRIGCDISACWQSRGMMKFDFTFSEKKRFEIKSTLKPDRVHHFKHDQLCSELYDIRVVSVMLRKSDCGISLSDLISEIQTIYADQYPLLMHIATSVSQVEQSRLEALIYDEIYLVDHLRYYDAAAIPHFNEMTPDGVFNAEYDCSLSNAPALSEQDIINWVSEG